MGEHVANLDCKVILCNCRKKQMQQRNSYSKTMILHLNACPQDQIALRLERQSFYMSHSFQSRDAETAWGLRLKQSPFGNKIFPALGATEEPEGEMPLPIREQRDRRAKAFCITRNAFSKLPRVLIASFYQYCCEGIILSCGAPQIGQRVGRPSV